MGTRDWGLGPDAYLLLNGIPSLPRCSNQFQLVSVLKLGTRLAAIANE